MSRDRRLELVPTTLENVGRVPPEISVGNLAEYKLAPEISANGLEGVGIFVGANVGRDVGVWVGVAVVGAEEVGTTVGACEEGASVGRAVVGSRVGCAVGLRVGMRVGAREGAEVRRVRRRRIEIRRRRVTNPSATGSVKVWIVIPEINISVAGVVAEVA